MKEKRFFWAFPILTGALALHAAVLTPNPNSLLPGKRVLILDGTSTSHAATRTAAFAKIQAIQTAVGFTMTHLTAVTSVTTAYLNNYDIVLFDYFFETQLTTATFQTAIKTWLASGNKGYIGYHTSGANEAGEWDWYRDSVTSMRYYLHTNAAQQGTIRKTTTDTAALNPNFPLMQGLPASFSGIDEWYTFNYGLTWPDVHVIYNLDETTLGTPMQTPMNPHPAVWYRTDSRGTKYFYGIIIHDPTGITSTTDFFQNLTLRALEWEAGYAPVPIVNGHPLKPKGVICMCLANRDLQVHAHGAYTLNVWSPQGKLLYSVKNSTASIHRIPAFSKPGMYLAKIESGEGSFSQRVMVY